MSDTRPTGTTHDPDAVERVAKAVYASRDRRIAESDAVSERVVRRYSWEAMPEFVRNAYRADAIAALDAIDELYVDEGGARP